MRMCFIFLLFMGFGVSSIAQQVQSPECPRKKPGPADVRDGSNACPKQLQICNQASFNRNAKCMACVRFPEPDNICTRKLGVEATKQSQQSGRPKKPNPHDDERLCRSSLGNSYYPLYIMQKKCKGKKKVSKKDIRRLLRNSTCFLKPGLKEKDIDACIQKTTAEYEKYVETTDANPEMRKAALKTLKIKNLNLPKKGNYTAPGTTSAPR